MAIMTKVYLLANYDKRAADIRKWFKANKLGRTVSLTAKPALADLFVVAGGDGALLHAIRVLGKYAKPFFGINRGTSGFLLNPIETAEELAQVLKKISACKLIKLHMLKGELAAGKGNKIKSFYAFNDFYVKAARGNSRIMGTIQGAKNFPKQEFEGDGLIISTPQGSTAYNYAAGGAIVSLGANQLAVKSICARIPLRAVVPDQLITVEITRGQATAYADHSRIMVKVKKIAISPSAKAVVLAFKPGYDFEFKRWQV